MRFATEPFPASTETEIAVPFPSIRILPVYVAMILSLIIDLSRRKSIKETHLK
jgi:hypothetical protein